MSLYYEQIHLPANESFRLIRWHQNPGEAEAIDIHGRPVPFAGAGERWHYHPEVELTLVEQGEGIHVVGDQMTRFRGPDLLLLGSNLPHHWKGLRPSNGMSLQFHPNSPAFRALPEAQSLSTFLKEAERGLRFTGNTRRRIRQKFREISRSNALRRIALFWEMLSILVEIPSTEREHLSSQGFGHIEDSPYQEQMQMAVRWIFDHAQDETAALPDLLKFIAMSRATFARQFPKHTGQTFTGFLNRIRLELARHHLADSQMSIAAAAFASGYSNLSYFNRVFRLSTKETPSMFRRRVQSLKETS